MDTTLKTEQLRLEQLTGSRILGICYVDGQGRLMQVFDHDDSFRTMLLDYQKERVAQLKRSDRAADRLHTLLNYPVQED